MARIAIRSIALALVAASLLVVATIVLVRLAPRPASNPAELTQQVPIDTIAVQLDANGVGMQVLDDAILSVKLDPYPPHANAPFTLTLVALDRERGAVLVITPTLSVAPLDEVDGADVPMSPSATGAYVARGELFPDPGPWRVRARIDFGAGEPYSMLILADAR